MATHSSSDPSLASFSVVLRMINLAIQQLVINQHICKLLHVQVEFKNALKLLWVLPRMSNDTLIFSLDSLLSMFNK